MRRSAGATAGRIGVACSLISWTVSSFTAVAVAAQDESDEAKRWLPAAAIEVGLDITHIRGQQNPSALMGPPGPGNYPDSPDVGDPVFIQPTTKDDQISTTPIAGMDFELMSPMLFESLGAPRVFVDVNLSATFGRKDTLGKTGSVGPMFLPEPEDVDPTRIPEGVWDGQGSAIDSTLEPFAVRAGIGVAFTKDYGETRIRFKPSIVYNRSEIKVVGETNRVVQVVPDPVVMPGNPDGFLAQYRFIALRTARKDVFHGVGPAMEVEMDSGRFGDFVTSLYVKGHVSFIIGDTDTKLFAGPNEYGEYARYNHEMERWSVRASTGFRVRWNPE